MPLDGLPGYPQHESSYDQVPRLHRFRARHPHIVITPPNPVSGGDWTAEQAEELLARNSQLENLLDVLDAR